MYAYSTPPSPLESSVRDVIGQLDYPELVAVRNVDYDVCVRIKGHRDGGGGGRGDHAGGQLARVVRRCVEEAADVACMRGMSLASANLISPGRF